MACVASIRIAPVKALGLVELDEVEVRAEGVAENRCFYLIDEDGRMFNNKSLGPLMAIRPEYDADAGTLRLHFPDGETVGGAVALGDAVSTDFYGRAVHGRLVLDGFSEALSEFAGKAVSLVRADKAGGGVDRSRGTVSIVSRASLARLAEAAGADGPVDERRFRMLFGIDGVGAHEEDEWLGRRVTVGGAVVVPRGQVGRCVVTTQNPDSGVPDLRTLHALRGYRPHGTERLPFGIFGDVLEPGRVRVGDDVSPA